MIGVIVWSSVAREKAVIWCEDQASLAYLQGRDSLTGTMVWPQPGDLVELEAEMIGVLRHARDVRLLSEQSCPELPVLLQEHAAAQSQPRLKLVAEAGIASTTVVKTADNETPAPRWARVSAAG